MAQTEFPFELPVGLIDQMGVSHREGIMRLATTADEILPLRDPRVIENAAYKDVLVLARVIVRLGTISSVTPKEIEALYIRDLNHLRSLYREINDLPSQPPAMPPSE